MSKKWIYAAIAGVVLVAAVVTLFVTAPVPQADAADASTQEAVAGEPRPEAVADEDSPTQDAQPTQAAKQTQNTPKQPAPQNDPTPDPTDVQPVPTTDEPASPFVPSPNPVESAAGLTLIGEPLEFGPAWRYLFELNEFEGEFRSEDFQVSGTELRFTIVIDDLPPGQTIHASLVPSYQSDIIRSIGSFWVEGADQVTLTGIHPEYYSLQLTVTGPELDDMPTWSITLEEK